MKDDACISFLQWALPRLDMRWPGFKKVRGQVCKRLGRRLVELNLAALKEYRAYLEGHPLEWHILDSMCRITISRFYRDRGVFDNLASKVLPELIKKARQHGEKQISCWCIGAASGEEPYTISLLWDFSELDRQGMELSILATEVDQQMINRARQGCYPASSIKELPEEMKIRGFEINDQQFCLKERLRKRVRFLKQDIRNELPDETFHLILCRNLVFTYFTEELQEEVGRKIIARLKINGYLMIGAHEKMPAAISGLAARLPGQEIYRLK